MIRDVKPVLFVGGFNDDEANQMCASGEWSKPLWSESRQQWMMTRLKRSA